MDKALQELEEGAGVTWAELGRGMIWALLASRGILDQMDHRGPQGPLENR